MQYFVHALPSWAAEVGRQDKGWVTLHPWGGPHPVLQRVVLLYGENALCGLITGETPAGSGTSWRHCQESPTLFLLCWDLSLLFLAVPSPWYSSHIFSGEWQEVPQIPQSPDKLHWEGPFARLLLFIQQHLPTRWSSKCSDLWWLLSKLYLEKLIVG